MAGEPNILLTGFMATGKSVVGRALAAVLGRAFVDTDQRIAADNQPIPRIFAEHGEETFRRLEFELACELAGETDLVIATGGGMLMRPETADVLLGSGRIFCLTAEPRTIVDRVLTDGIDDRPMLAGGDPGARVAALLADRAERYAQFEAVATDDRSVADIVADIVTRLEG